MVGFIILLFVMIGIWVLLMGAADTSEISKNWPQYRCQPTVMPFASFFGHDTSENFQFCLKGIMNNEAGPLLSPIFMLLGSFLSTITSLMQVANSLRLQFSTFLGGINTIFQNFTDRFKQLTFKIQMTAFQMKSLMGRLYATFFALIYMSMSGIRALQNFGDTVLFKFLDTFCFDPDTLVEIQGKGLIAVKDVKIGDIFTKTGSRVTSTFRFQADGQPMVRLSDVIVSTNHFVKVDSLLRGSWVRADQHPDAISIGDWSGGSERPLICFNTSDHQIPVGPYMFADYDETEAGDSETMTWVENRLNSTFKKAFAKGYAYDTVFDPEVQVKMADGSYVKASDLHLDDKTSMGNVAGLVKKEIREVCTLSTGERVSPGQLIWDKEKTQWVRAGSLLSRSETREDFISVIVTSGQAVQTSKDSFFRDYVEVHSPETEAFYAKAMTSSITSE